MNGEEDPRFGALLVRLARESIGTAFGHPTTPPAAEEQAWLARPGAVFVTLQRAGRLRGCIGSLEAWRPLGDDLRENARAAAFHDPRFAPLTEDEFPQVRIEVSLLEAPQPLAVRDAAEACGRLRPGVDGVILEGRARRATFLPQVWAQLPDPAEFLARLREKAGLPPDAWGPDFRLLRYGVRHWAEP